MNNYYLKSFIADKEKRLKILKYNKVNITESSPLLMQITAGLMDECYNQAHEFHVQNKEKNKRYSKIENKVTNQLKDLLYVKKKFLVDFSKPGKKTKGDLYTYVYAHQMPEHFYDQYLYRVLFKSLKEEFPEEFWHKHGLEKHLTGRILSNFFPIFADTKEELSTGRIDFDLEKPAELINKAVENYSVDDDKRLMAKLNIVKDLSNVIEDHPNLEMLMIHSPYRSSIDDLVDDIKVSLDSEKVKQFVKRRNI